MGTSGRTGERLPSSPTTRRTLWVGQQRTSPYYGIQRPCSHRQAQGPQHHPAIPHTLSSMGKATNRNDYPRSRRYQVRQNCCSTSTQKRRHRDLHEHYSRSSTTQRIQRVAWRARGASGAHRPTYGVIVHGISTQSTSKTKMQPLTSYLQTTTLSFLTQKSPTSDG